MKWDFKGVFSHCMLQDLPFTITVVTWSKTSSYTLLRIFIILIPALGIERYMDGSKTIQLISLQRLIQTSI